MESYKKQIYNYLKTSVNDAYPLLFDFQNIDDYCDAKEICKNNTNCSIINVKDYCIPDEMPNLDKLLHDIQNTNCNLVIEDISVFLKIQGSKYLKNILYTILNTANSKQIVILTYELKSYVSVVNDPRIKQRIHFVENEMKNKNNTTLVFVNPKLTIPNISYISSLSVIDETSIASNSCVFVKTNKNIQDFPLSLYSMKQINSSYDVLKIFIEDIIDQKWGNEQQWQYLLSLFQKDNLNNLRTLLASKFDNINNLEIFLRNWNNYNEYEKWLYFLALKIFGVKNNWCLQKSIKKSQNLDSFIQNIYYSLTDEVLSENDYWIKYENYKRTVSEIHDAIELDNYCKFISTKGEKAIYYLTDNTQQEKELIVECISEKLKDSLSCENLQNILKHVYLDLYDYLSPYQFNENIFTDYIQKYKYQKVINIIDTKFEQIVNNLAKDRIYNKYLSPRNVCIDKLKKDNSKLYFIDAMGVEYLGYIIAKSNNLGLRANIQIGIANIPTITSLNKDFVDRFKQKGIEVTEIIKLDKIKHNPEEKYNYEKTKLPTYIISELNLIKEVLKQINSELTNAKFEKIFIISDHGASRLAVINNNTHTFDVDSKGTNSGRICKYNDSLPKIDTATIENDYYVLADHSRFKGGRAANVEVHGGATLEEVMVPIIELSKQNITDTIDVKFLDNKVIYVSYRKKASICLYISCSNLKNVKIKVENTFYNAYQREDNQYAYIFDMPELKKAKQYSFDVYLNNNIIKKDLSFEIRKEGSQENELF